MDRENGGMHTPRDDAEADYLFELHGYLLLRGALSATQVEAVNAWVDAQPQSRPGDWLGHVHVHSYQGHDGTNYQNIIEGGPVFEQLIDHPAWIGHLRRWICNHYNHLSINECFLNLRGPGGFIGIHSGGHYPALPMMTRHPGGGWMVGQVNVLMALRDVGPGDGGTVLIPGSHKCQTIHPFMAAGQIPTYRDTEPATEAFGMREMHLRAGDVLLFTDGVTHGAAARTNPGERRILIYRYSPHALATRYQYVPSDELLARLTPERRAIIQPVHLRMAPGRVLRSDSAAAGGGPAKAVG
jgi:hypothetical protein